LLALGRTDEALASYERALAGHPVNPRYRATVAMLQMQRGNPGRAVELYRDEIHEWPRLPENWYRLADALAAAGRPTEARDALDEACRRAKGDHAVVNGFGLRFLTSGRPGLAEVALREAIRLEPDYVPAYNNLGRALEALNRADEAKKAYQTAMKLQPGNRDAAAALARMQTGRSPASSPSAFSASSSTMPAR
jgi:tetratricopeptide (TPR) repeat protein